MSAAESLAVEPADDSRISRVVLASCPIPGGTVELIWRRAFKGHAGAFGVIVESDLLQESDRQSWSKSYDVARALYFRLVATLTSEAQSFADAAVPS